MLLALSLQATIKADLVTGVLGLFLTMFLLCVCVGLIGTYVQHQRDLDWQQAERETRQANKQGVCP